MIRIIRKKLNNIFAIIGLLGFSFTVSANSNNSSLNIAIVDTVMIQQYLVSSVDKSLEKDFKNRYESLNEQAKEIADQQSKFRKEKEIMKASAKEAAENKIQKMQVDYQEKAAAFEADLNARRSEEIRPKFELILDTVKEISRKENYQIVLTKTAALYVDNKYDITENVIKAYDEKNK